MLGLGLGLTARQRGGSFAWTPAALFAGGEQGGWYDPADLASMFLDSAGTTAATVGQPVGLIRDKSGRGNDLSQATGAARPILRQDLSGRHYLEFDGVDDHLGSIAAGLRITGDLSIVVAGQKSGGSFAPLVSCQTNAASLNQYEFRANNGSPTSVLEFVAADAGMENESFAGPFAVGTNHVFSLRRTAGVNAEAGVNSFVSTMAHTKVPTSDANSAFRLGSRKGSPLFLQGRIYDVFLIAKLLSGTEMDQLRTHQAAKSGVAL